MTHASNETVPEILKTQLKQINTINQIKMNKW